jgi:hypothetical protein
VENILKRKPSLQARRLLFSIRNTSFVTARRLLNHSETLHNEQVCCTILDLLPLSDDEDNDYGKKLMLSSLLASNVLNMTDTALGDLVVKAHTNS